MLSKHFANLSFGATEETLRSMFENYGTVERVSIVTDRETGRSRALDLWK
jgi:cold-inducible RNA-binding protein